MAVTLAKQLETLGIKTTPDQFRETLSDLHALMHPSWTDEELLLHPSDASRYCEVIRRRVGESLPDRLILSTLIGMRKSCRKV